jgi:hypothetical protein
LILFASSGKLYAWCDLLLMPGAECTAYGGEVRLCQLGIFKWQQQLNHTAMHQWPVQLSSEHGHSTHFLAVLLAGTLTFFCGSLYEDVYYYQKRFHLSLGQFCCG